MTALYRGGARNGGAIAAMPAPTVDYDGLAIFLAVAEERSFSKAAKRLGVGKGTISRAIASLEETVGAELVHRTPRAVALSTAGTALYERTALHLRAVDEAFGRLPERGELPSGVLRLTAPHDFAITVLADVLAEFALRYPDVSFDTRITNARVDLVAEGFDLAIRMAPGRLADSSLTARKVGAASTSFFAAPAYLARRGTPRALWSKDHDWIAHRGMVDYWKVPAVQVRHLSDDMTHIRELARAGAGVAFLPDYLAAPYVRAGTLVRVDVPHKGLTSQIVLLYPSSGQVPRKVTAFRDFLVEWLASARGAISET
jgi:DNA-binding transcriptional LysR family regulator